MIETLSLSEKLYLLAINSQKGGVYFNSRTAMEFVIPGSLILELYQNKNIEFEGKRLIINNMKSTNPLHNLILERLETASRPLRISRWISKLHFSIRKIRRPLQEQLVEKRLIRMEERSFLFFHWKVPVLVRKEVPLHLVSEIDKIIYNGCEDESDRYFLSLIIPAELMRRIYPEREKRKKAMQKIKGMNLENPVAEAVTHAIRAARAAAVAAAT